MSITTAETRGLDQAEYDALESLMDRRGAKAVLEVLADLAGHKAAHIRSNWQDEPLARAWDKTGRKAYYAAKCAEGL